MTPGTVWPGLRVATFYELTDILADPDHTLPGRPNVKAPLCSRGTRPVSGFLYTATQKYVLILKG